MTNMIGKVTIVFVAAVCAVVLADRNPYRLPQPRSYSAPSPPRYSDDSFEDPKYVFDWEVNEAANNFEQQESRDGDNTKGTYSVDLPDGRRQTVTYFVDGDSGFLADVKYSGEARYPDSNEYSAPRPSYNPPRPVYTTPRPVYTTPRPTYTTPRPAYTPRPTTRRPAYSRPTTRRPSYSRPTTRRPSYSPPRNTYNAPNSLLAAFGVGK